MYFSWLFLDPHLSTYHSNIGVWLRKVTKLGTSSLSGRRADAAAHCSQLFQRTIRDQNENTSNLPSTESLSLYLCSRRNDAFTSMNTAEWFVWLFPKAKSDLTVNTAHASSLTFLWVWLDTWWWEVLPVKTPITWKQSWWWIRVYIVSSLWINHCRNMNLLSSNTYSV